MKKVFVSGNFFVLHPGHVRLLRFAKNSGDKLYVGVNDTRPSKNYPSTKERAETLRELGIVDEVIILVGGLEPHLIKIKPDLVIKGQEYETARNSEEEILKNWDGKILFTSGDSVYSGTDLLRDSTPEDSEIWHQPKDYIKRHHCHRDNLLPIVDKFKSIKVLVIGDLILDEYIQCEALGMSREDPTLVIAPQETKRYLGGAGIVAAHCKGLGAEVDFLSVVGEDECYAWAKKNLAEYGVNATFLHDSSRQTTLKQRYRVAQKTIMRVSHLQQHEISKELQDKIYKKIEKKINKLNLIIFSDFNYGVLPQALVDKLIKLGKKNNVLMAADSQTSSQIGDITRFTGVDLITPTEHEVRVSLRESSVGLHKLAEELIVKCGFKLAVITLGEAGCLILNNETILDRLPAINYSSIDVSGAGDSMLAGISLSLAVDANALQATYIGAIISAVQISRVGNIPIKIEEIKNALF